jgi:hypothetical protein
LKLVEKRKIIPSGIDPQPSSRIQSIEMWRNKQKITNIRLERYITNYMRIRVVCQVNNDMGMWTITVALCN